MNERLNRKCNNTGKCNADLEKLLLFKWILFFVNKARISIQSVISQTTMFPSESKKISVPPRNPKWIISNNNNLLSVEFILNKTVQNREFKKYEEINLFVDEITNNIPIHSTQSAHHDVYCKRLEDIPITRINDIIVRHGGKTASIDRLPEQLKIIKERQITEREELLELKRENEQLRAEIVYHENIRQVLMKLYSICVEMYKTSLKMMKKLHETVQTSSQKLIKAEREYLHFWGISVNLDEKNNRWSHDLNEKANYIWYYCWKRLIILHQNVQN